MKRMLRALSVLTLSAGLVSATGRVEAQDPLAPPTGFVPMGATPGTAPAQRPVSPYQVPAKAGTWMILAASYTGQNAVYLADQVVKQLREKHRIAAYSWNFADQQRRKDEEEFNQRARANPNVPYRRRITRIEDQCAVLIGGFATNEAAHGALGTIKKLPPPDVYAPSGQRVADTFVQIGEDDRGPKPKTAISRRAEVNPFARAFVVRNPAVPQEAQDPTTKVDPLWKKLNANEEFSLLKNRKEWTLVVKFYQGPGSLQANGQEAQEQTGGFLDKLGLGAKSRSALDATALQAHELARVMRQMGYESYVLHTRHGSLVTVGGFAKADDDQMRQTQQKLSSFRLMGVGGQPVGNAHDLFPQPMPMRVPRL